MLFNNLIVRSSRGACRILARRARTQRPLFLPILFATLIVAAAAANEATAAPAFIPQALASWVLESEYIVVGEMVLVEPFDRTTPQRSGKLLVHKALYGDCAPDSELTIHWLAHEWYPEPGVKRQLFDDMVKPDAVMNEPAFWCLSWKAEDLPLAGPAPMLFERASAEELLEFAAVLEARADLIDGPTVGEARGASEMTDHRKLQAAATFFTEKAREKLSQTGNGTNGAFLKAQKAARARLIRAGILANDKEPGR